MTAYLGYKNLIPEGVVSGSEMPGFPFENAYDWFTYTWWRQEQPLQAQFYITFEEPVTVEYFGMAAHNYNVDNLGIRVQRSSNNVDWVDWMPLVFPETNAPVFFLGAPLPAQYWRILSSSTEGIEPPYVGVFSLGEVLELPEGIRPSFTPPPAAVNNKIFNSESATGQFLGRSVERFGYQINIKQDQIDPAWVRENWYEIANMLSTQPFFYSWNYEEYPDDTVYAWLDGDMPIPKYTNPIHMEFAIKARALHLIRWF